MESLGQLSLFIYYACAYTYSHLAFNLTDSIMTRHKLYFRKRGEVEDAEEEEEEKERRTKGTAK